MQAFCWCVYSIYNYQMLFLLLYRLRYDLVTVLEIGYNLVRGYALEETVVRMMIFKLFRIMG
ncbi:hypothetical protein HMPREF3027_07580 [Porphyromonas sp. HMSC077F02]|nr:hypothetical protein HMPREF3027_07580 [Porphyromonas sp. HMSC077F02]